MAKISSSSILFCIGFLLLLVTVSAATGKAAPAPPSGNTPDGSECPMRDAANSMGTSRIVDCPSIVGCMKSCFKKCGKSKTQTGLACRQMTATKVSCGCCCSKDMY